MDKPFNLPEIRNSRFYSNTEEENQRYRQITSKIKMADIILLGGSLALTLSRAPACVLKQHRADNSSRRLSPLSISLGLSFSLFALSVLEAMPSSWLVALDNRVVGIGSITDDGSSRDDNEYLTLSHIYSMVLSLLAAYVLAICPSMAGVILLDRVFQLQNCNPVCCLPKERPVWLKLVSGVISFVAKTVLVFLSIFVTIVQRFWRLFCFKKRLSSISRDNGKSLPMTTIDAEKHAKRSRISMNCLNSRVYDLLLRRGGIILVGSMLGIAVTLLALHWLAPFIMQPKSLENWLAVGVCWMTSIGILLSQLINGFGSVSMPHSCLAGLYLEPIRPETVTKATIGLEKTKESLLARKQQLRDMRTATISPSNVNISTKVSRWNMGTSRTTKRTFSGLGEDIKQQKRVILEEVAFLERLVSEMTEDVEDMKYTQQMEADSRTTVGRVKSWLGVIFSVILLVRLYFAAMAIWRHWYSDIDAVDQTKKDPVTTSLLWLVGHNMVTEKEYDQFSQAISLLLTAILSGSQVRTFLRTIAAIHRRINHLFCNSSTTVRLTPRDDSSGGITDEPVAFPTRTGVYLHGLASLMGSYFLACVVMTKSMLPWQYRASFSGALGGLDAFVLHTDVITALFAMSAVASAIVLALLFGIQKSNSVRHNVSWKDDVTNSGRGSDA